MNAAGVVRLANGPLDTSVGQSSGREDRAKTISPEPNRFVADVDAAFVQQILDIA